MSARDQLLAVKRAIRAGDVQVVGRLLLDNPGLVVARGHGWTPLQDAAFQAKTAILKVMLAHGVGVTALDIAHALHHAVQLPHTDSQRMTRFHMT